MYVLAVECCKASVISVLVENEYPSLIKNLLYSVSLAYVLNLLVDHKMPFANEKYSFRRYFFTDKVGAY